MQNVVVRRKTQEPVKKVTKMREVTPKRVKQAVDLHSPSSVHGNMARHRMMREMFSKNIAEADLANRIIANLDRYQGVDVIGNLTVLVNNLPKKA